MIVTAENQPILERLFKDAVMKHFNKKQEFSREVDSKTMKAIREFLPELTFLYAYEDGRREYEFNDYTPRIYPEIGTDIDFGYVMAKIKFLNKQDYYQHNGSFL